ncbi:MAG: hypothetical protein BM555_04630 [Crocinitomix sp. MedPE-SWsnd]|jgi:hypothetical protein|nr:MAG: hypothetical protein BM555_04630 [Crocinitomix sp. MedPE-SWsnd]
MLRFINQFRSTYEGKLFKYTLFLIFFWLVLGYFQLNGDLDQMFYGPHYWRQADGLAQTMNYVKNGYDFFDHSLYYNQFNGSAKGVGEFPIMYYLIALQKGAFGGDLFFLFRLNNFIIGFFALLSIFKMSHHFLRSAVLSIATTFLLFCSAVFGMYYLSPMPDPLAFNLSMIGYWWMMQYYYKRRSRFLLGSVFILSIAFMVKFYFIIPFLAFLVLLVVRRLLKIEPFLHLKFHPFQLIPVLAGIGWLVYMSWYNASGTCNCFLSEIMPIWSLDSVQMEKVWYSIFYYRYDYMSKYILILFAISLLINFSWWDRKFVLMNWYLLISVVGSLLFVLFFFQMFESHDYYVYPIVFLIPLSIGMMCYKLKTIIEGKARVQRFALISLSIVLLGIQNAVPNFEKRKWDKSVNHQEYYANYKNTDIVLEEVGVKQTASILSLSDVTPNYSLFLMDRVGWSAYQAYYLKWTMNDFIDKDVEFLVFNNNLNLWDAKKHAEGYLDFPLGEMNEIAVYDLRPYGSE